MFCLEPAGHSAHLYNRRGGGIVYKNRGLGKYAKSVLNSQKIIVLPFARKIPCANAPKIHISLRRDKAVNDLLPGHFQTKYAHRHFGFDGDISCDIKRERSFSKTRPRGKDNKIGFLQAGKIIIQIRKTRRHTPCFPLMTVKFINSLKRFFK